MDFFSDVRDDWNNDDVVNDGGELDNKSASIFHRFLMK